jgi:SAM-dependent methyltransferase
MPSRLLDMREAADPQWRTIYDGMLRLALLQQPAWFRPLLLRNRRLQRMSGYDHWSRAWEYPWAVRAALLGPAPQRVLDVGGGGSPFAPWLAAQGHEAHVVDPSLDQGRWFAWDPGRSAWRNARTLVKQAAFRAAGVRSLWGLPKDGGGARLHYHARTADRLGFPDAHFDRVFSLSVIEHIPRDLWPACMREFARVLRPGGRLVMTMDMETEEADVRLYMRLVDSCPLTLLGDPHYPAPVDRAEAQRRHPGNWYETLGLVWTRDEAPGAVGSAARRLGPPERGA